MRGMKRFLPAAAAFLLAACAGAPRRRTYSAASQDSRIQFIVLHFTSTDFPESLAVLTQGRVSAHYLVRDDPVIVYRLVDDRRRAWHAGESAWEGNTQLNSASIGIEIVNRGDRDGAWQDYPPAQVDAVVALVKRSRPQVRCEARSHRGTQRHRAAAQARSGAALPWKRLADVGLAEWPAADLVAVKRPAYEAVKPDAEWFQQRLACVGYPIERTGRFDEQTRRVLSAFQMHFRPAEFSGTPDGESAAILDALASLRPGDAFWCAG